jgi:hypothetical protein
MKIDPLVGRPLFSGKREEKKGTKSDTLAKALLRIWFSSIVYPRGWPFPLTCLYTTIQKREGNKVVQWYIIWCTYVCRHYSLMDQQALAIMEAVTVRTHCRLSHSLLYVRVVIVHRSTPKLSTRRRCRIYAALQSPLCTTSHFLSLFNFLFFFWEISSISFVPVCMYVYNLAKWQFPFKNDVRAPRKRANRQSTGHRSGWGRRTVTPSD